MTEVFGFLIFLIYFLLTGKKYKLSILFKSHPKTNKEEIRVGKKVVWCGIMYT